MIATLDIAPTISPAGKRWLVTCPDCGELGKNTTEAYATELAKGHAAAVHDVQDVPVDRIFSTLEVAAYLEVSEHTVRRWRQLGKGPSFTTDGRHAFYRRSDVDVWRSER